MYEIGKVYVWCGPTGPTTHHLRNTETTVLSGPKRAKCAGKWCDFWETDSKGTDGITIYARAGDLRRIDPPAEKAFAKNWTALFLKPSKAEMDAMFSASCENAREAAGADHPNKGQQK